jgi:hypothetical protein
MDSKTSTQTKQSSVPGELSLCHIVSRGFSSFPLSIHFHPFTVGDTIRAWVALLRFAHLLNSLDDTAVVAAI